MVYNMFNIKQKGADIIMNCKIKEYRLKQGLTQSALAEKSGVSRGTIVALEKGTATTSTTKTLYKIALALNATVENIFFDNAV